MTYILHTTGPVVITTPAHDPDPAVNTVIGGIRNLAANLGSQIKGEPSSGEIYARLVALYGQKPTVRFDTEDIQGGLTNCGPLGLSLATKPLTLYGSKLLAGGGIDTTGHVSLACALGILYPKTLTVAHQGDASMGYEAMLYNSTDSADPFTLATNAVLPTAVAFERWALGTCSLGGTPVTQQMNVSIDFGVRCFGEGADSNVRDQIVSIQSIEPKITVTSSLQGKLLAFLGVSGAFSIVLRNRLAGGSFGPKTITIAATAGLAMQETPFQASGHRPGDISLAGHIAWDGTNAPLTYAYSAGT